jgi:MFS family permease
VVTSDARLPRAVTILQLGLVFNAFGNGAVGPFTVIYLHDVRGIPLGIAGLAAGVGSLCALVSALVAGALADRLGPRTTLLGGLALATATFATYPLIRESWHALALAVAAGTGAGAWLTSQSSLVAALTPRELRHAAFARQRVAANLGLGIGGMTAGLIVSTSSPGTFTILYLGNAITFLVYGAFVLRLPHVRSVRPATGGGYRPLLRYPALVRLLLVTFAFVAGAVSLLNSLAPVFAKHEAGVSEREIGLLFLVNTAFIVVAQMPIARAQEGRRRTRALAVLGCFFALAWLVTEAAGAWLTAAAATAVLALAFLVFAVAECLYDAVQGPLVAALAPEGLLGRAMALSGFAWQLGFIAGPAAGGFLLGAEPFALWPVAAAICAGAGLYALTLERALPETERLTPARPAPTPA